MGTFGLETTDKGTAFSTLRGVGGAGFTSTNASAAAVAITDASVGFKVTIDDIILSVDTAMTVTFTEETSGELVDELYLPANSAIQITPRGKLQVAAAGKKLMVQTSAAGKIAVTVLYHLEN